MVYIPPQGQKANTTDELHDSINGLVNVHAEAAFSVNRAEISTYLLEVSAHWTAPIQPSPRLAFGKPDHISILYSKPTNKDSDGF